MNWGLILGGVFGFLALALGAYADHGLRLAPASDEFDLMQLALRFALIHAVLLAAIGLAQLQALPPCLKRRLTIATIFVIAGVLLFSGGLVLAVVTGADGLKMCVPLGGTALMLGWLALAAAGVPRRD